MNFLSLFSGVGGLDLGLERAGMRCVGQVEIDAFCRRVLAKHWPDAPRHDDVRTCIDWWLGAARPAVDLVAAGIPCQPFSAAGHGRGVNDPRWEWPAFRAVVRAVRPRFVLVENSPRMLRHVDAFGQVVGELADLGFDVAWSLLSACAMGAPHTRERLFVVAYPQGKWLGQHCWFEHQPTDSQRHLHHWAAQPEPHRVADGVPRRMDRNRALGNAVVPQVAEYIGRLVVAAGGAR